MTAAAQRSIEDFIEACREKLGPLGVLTDEATVAPYLADPIGAYHGRAPVVLRPATTEEVAVAVRLAAGHGLAIVPQGGNTGFCGGAIPDASGREVVLSLARMNRIRAVDLANNTITVDGGCLLAAVQEEVERHNRLFPLSHGGEGSSQIGGNIATNAGGNAVLRYGTMRSLVLGLEVVLHDGRVFHGLRGLRKDTAGYDVKQLFIGAEGTLGVITGAVLKLFARPTVTETMLVALPASDAAVALLGRLGEAVGEVVTAFELMPRAGIDPVIEERGAADPMAARHDWYALIELQSASRYFDLRRALEDIVGAAMAEKLVLDAVIAESEAQRTALWRLREGLAVVQVEDRSALKNDTAVPTSAIPAFIREASARVTALVPGIRLVPFGHIGDGNIHFNMGRPLAMAPDDFIKLWPRLVAATEEIALAHGGSIAAEHGVGRSKRAALVGARDPVEYDLMRVLKRALDPNNRMNPGKVVEDG